MQKDISVTKIKEAKMQKDISVVRMVCAICVVGTVLLVSISGAVAEKIKLTFWSFPFVTQEVSPKYVEWWEKTVAKALPNIQVERFYGPGSYDMMRKKLLIQAKTGNPDVIEGLLEDLTVYTKAGLLSDLTNSFSAWDDKDNFIEATVSALTIDGKVYGMPYNTNGRGILYRKSILAKFGLSVPRTWKELVDTAHTITEKTNKDMYGYTFATKIGCPKSFQEFMAHFYQVTRGAPMFKKVEGRWVVNTTPQQLARVLKLYHDLLFAYPDYPAIEHAQRGNYWREEHEGYVNGIWAMVHMGPWLWGHRTRHETARYILEEDTGIDPLPVPEGGLETTYLEVKPIMVNAFSKHQEEAWELVKFITSKEAMAGWAWDSGFLPARSDVMAMPNFQGSWWMQGFSKFLPSAIALVPVNWLPPNQTILTAVNMVTYQVNTPEEAGMWLYDKLNDIAVKGLL